MCKRVVAVFVPMLQKICCTFNPVGLKLRRIQVPWQREAEPGDFRYLRGRDSYVGIFGGRSLYVR